jgi:hypothetical protein
MTETWSVTASTASWSVLQGPQPNIARLRNGRNKRPPARPAQLAHFVLGLDQSRAKSLRAHTSAGKHKFPYAVLPNLLTFNVPRSLPLIGRNQYPALAPHQWEQHGIVSPTLEVVSMPLVSDIGFVECLGEFVKIDVLTKVESKSLKRPTWLFPR